MKTKTLVMVAIGIVLLMATANTIFEQMKRADEIQKQEKYIATLIEQTENETDMQIEELNVEMQKAEKDKDISRLKNLAEERGGIIAYKMKRIASLKHLPEITKYNGCDNLKWLILNGALQPSDLKYNECFG